jgi:hypothetical protein
MPANAATKIEKNAKISFAWLQMLTVIPSNFSQNATVCE